MDSKLNILEWIVKVGGPLLLLLAPFGLVAFRVTRVVRRALRKNSAGGKKVTPEEWDEILGVLEEELRDLPADRRLRLIHRVADLIGPEYGDVVREMTDGGE